MNPNDIVLEIVGVTQSFGKKTVLYDCNLKVIRGEFVSLVGPSGCGKSTLLSIILGTLKPTNGNVFVYRKPGKQDGYQVQELSRDRGIVYQAYSLFPNKTVLENVALGLMFDESWLLDRAVHFLPLFRRQREQKLSWHKLHKIHLEEAEALLKEFRLGESIDKYPYQLSGGMQQRVAVAQSLIMKPSLLLLDEPFGALDEATRQEIQEFFLEIYHNNKQKVSVIIVTHELNEAIILGDRVIGLSQYWDSLLEEDARANGAATIVYDKVAPVFLPNKERDYSLYAAQRREIRRAVFERKILQPRSEGVKFWQQISEGEGKVGEAVSEHCKNILANGKE